MTFDRCCVINIDRRPERIERFYAQLPSDWPFPRPVRFRGIDGSLVSRPREYTQCDGAFGCQRSHSRLLEDCIQDKAASVLVLEDDAVCVPNFTAKWTQAVATLPRNWDMIMLGGEHKADPTPVNDHWVKVSSAGRTHAYAVSAKMMPELFSRWAMCDTHIDWRAEAFQSLFNVYAPKEWLVGQDGGPSDISAIHEPRRLWQTPKPDAPVVVLWAPKELLPDLRANGFHTGYHRHPQSDIDMGLLRVMNGSPGKRVAELRKWITDVQWEAFPGSVVCVWHPGANKSEVQRAWDGPVHEVRVATLPEAIAKLEWLRAAV